MSKLLPLLHFRNLGKTSESLSIGVGLARRFCRSRSQTHIKKLRPVEIQETSHARHGHRQSRQELGSRRDAERAAAYRDGQLQRTAREGGHHAGRRGAASVFEGEEG